MTDLNKEQENVLSQLSDIENILDSFLQLQNNEESSSTGNLLSSKSKELNNGNSLFNLQEKISSQVHVIENNIKELDDKVRIIYNNSDEIKKKIDEMKSQNETDTITMILNEFYHSLQALKYYQVS